MKQRIIAGIILVLSILFFYFIIIPVLNIPQFIESLKSTDLFLISVAVIIVLISNSAAAMRWSVILKEVGAERSACFSNAFGIFSLGQIAGLVVPSRVGNYTKIPLVMKLDTLSLESGLAAVNAETIVDMIYICCAGILSLLIVSVFMSSQFFLSAIIIVIIIISLITALIVFWKIQSFQGTYGNLRNLSSTSDTGIFVKIPATVLGALYELIVSTREIFYKKVIITKLGIYTLVIQMLGVIGFLLVIESTHTTLPLIYVFAILTLSFLVGIISLIPGGLGASDLSMIVLLENAGIALPVATNITLLWRCAMYIPILTVSSLFLIKIQFFSQKKTGY